MVNIASTLAFWRRRGAQKTSESDRIIPLPNLTSGVDILEKSAAPSPETVDRAREALKVLKLEKLIVGSAVTTIYESHSKGVISEVERDRMLEKYKVDVKRLEKEIEENQQVVDLHDLELERAELVKRFNAKLAELDARLGTLKSGPQAQKLATFRSMAHGSAGVEDSKQGEGSKGGTDTQDLTDAEQRLKQIREEILKAMDRLEQIETEG